MPLPNVPVAEILRSLSKICIGLPDYPAVNRGYPASSTQINSSVAAYAAGDEAKFRIFAKAPEI